MVTKQRDRETVRTTHEPRTAPNEVKLYGGTFRTGSIVLIIGIMEVIYGALATFVSVFGAVPYVWLLSGIVLISGTLGIATTLGRGNWARFSAAVISAVTGFLGLAHPIFGLAFFGLLMASYLTATGIARLFSFEQPVLTRIFGAIAILFGIWVYFTLPAANAIVIEILVGINIIFQGVLSIITGSDLIAA
jgi:uncharacterized membrane protein HdeD (DUF308 family)